MAYASVPELQMLLRLDSPSALQVEAMQRNLDAASEEIDWELGYTSTSPAPDPPPALVVEVCLERAVEHWKAGQSPFGAILVADEAVVASKNSWHRHRLKLWPLKTTVGIAQMPTATVTVEEMAVALAEALADNVGAEIEGLQVTAYLNTNATPPSLDVYPGDPFLVGDGFGVESFQAFFTIRARVTTADSASGQRLLYRLLEPSDSASVQAAIAELAAVVPEGVSGFREYLEDGATNGRLLGCEWRVAMFSDGG